MTTLDATAKSILRRLAAELLDILRNPPDGVSGHPVNGNLFNWTGAINGPDDSPYEDGTFILNINIPENYPLKPPRVVFATKVYHPNVDSDSGFISLGILSNEWSPVLTVSKILLSVQAYLVSPDTTDAVMPEIAQQYASNRVEYERTARQWTKKYAARAGAVDPAE